MGWFSKKTEEEKQQESLSQKKERQIEDLLLGFALEAYKDGKFTVNFSTDYDREDKEYTPKLFQLEHHRDKWEVERRDKWEHLKDNNSLVVIECNDSYGYRNERKHFYKNGGLNFTIYSKNDEGHITEYPYNNIGYIKGGYQRVKDKFDMNISICNGTYYDWKSDVETYFLEGRWSTKEEDRVSIEIHRMKKLEKLINLMVDEQEIDQEARNIRRMDKVLGIIPKRAKREKILRELLGD